MIQRMLAIWSLVPLAFLNPTWTSGSSQLRYCWSLAWRILSITSMWDERNCEVVWYPHLFQNFPQFIVIYIVKGFGIVNKAVDAFLEVSYFFNDPMDVGNLISGSSAFSKSSLSMWKFSIYILLKPVLQNFEHYFTSVWNECNCVVVWAFFGIAFLHTYPGLKLLHGTRLCLFDS